MSEAGLVIQYGGVILPTGAIAGVAWWVIKNLGKTIIEKNNELMSSNNRAQDARFSLLETELKKTQEALSSAREMIHMLDTLGATITVKIDNLDKSIEKHDRMLHEVLPAIKTEIGKLSIYWKK